MEREESYTPSCTTDASSATTALELQCNAAGCTAVFRGLYAKGNLARHKRHNHNGPRVYICEDEGCDRVFRRHDARFKHYRKHHSSLAKPDVPRNNRTMPIEGKRDLALSNISGWTCTTDESDKAKVSKRWKNFEDDAPDCSGTSVDSSEERDDSDYECDRIITWNYSQHDALPSFLPYIRVHEEDTSSPCGDSPDSGATTSGTTSHTTVSSASGLTGGNGLQENGYTPPSAGTGFPNHGNNPVPTTKHGFGAKVADPQPLPLICWYPAAGIACNGKHVSSSSKIRYLWQ